MNTWKTDLFHNLYIIITETNRIKTSDYSKGKTNSKIDFEKVQRLHSLYKFIARLVTL